MRAGKRAGAGQGRWDEMHLLLTCPVRRGWGVDEGRDRAGMRAGQG
jgi:hypothetical protein